MSWRSSVGAFAGSANLAPGANSSRNPPLVCMSSAASRVRANASQSRPTMYRSFPCTGQREARDDLGRAQQPVEGLGVGRLRMHGNDETAPGMVSQHLPVIRHDDAGGGQTPHDLRSRLVLQADLGMRRLLLRLRRDPRAQGDWWTAAREDAL